MYESNAIERRKGKGTGDKQWQSNLAILGYNELLEWVDCISSVLHGTKTYAVPWREII